MPMIGRVGVRTLFGVGMTGFLGGMLSERLRNNKAEFCYPTIVSAASPIPPKDLVPSAGDSVDSSWIMDKPNRVSQIMKFGFPGMDNIRSFSDFVVSYDRRNKVPHWVFEHITRSDVQFNPSVKRDKCEFFEDNSVHPYFRSTNADYKGSGYDRGHLAAAGNHRTHQQCLEETFVLSNISPQVGKGFNRDSWNRLEKYVRGLTKVYDHVYVCTGPLYLPRRGENGKFYVTYEVIGKNNVSVPTHFFKVVLGESASTGQLDVEAFIMPNTPIDDKDSLDAFRVPVDAVERAAGLLFFDRIPKGNLRIINRRR